MTKFEEMYQEYREWRHARNTASTEEEKDRASEMRDAFDAKFDNTSRAFREAWADYRDSKDSGYALLNCENSPSVASEYAAVLRENGIEKFTFSSTWSGAVKDVWEFRLAGYELDGMTNVPKTAFVLKLRNN